MHKRTDFIDIVKKNASDPLCRELLVKMSEYYKINDIDTGNFYGEIFNALYIENHETYDEISATHCVALCTIHRLRIKFNRLAVELAPTELKKKFNVA